MTRAVAPLALVLLLSVSLAATPADLSLLRELSDRGETDKALELCARLLSVDPHDLPVAEMLQDLRLAKEDRAAVAADYAARAAKPEAGADEHYLSARVLDGEPGIEELRRALSLDAGHFGALCLLGSRLTERGAFAEAKDLLERAWHKNEASAVPPNLLGWLAEQSGDRKRAELLYRESASLDAQFLLPRLNLGLMLVSEQRLAEASEFLDAARKIAPRNPMPLIGLGMARTAAGERAEAMAYLEAAGALPANTVASLNLLGGAYISLGQFELARAAFGRALRLDGSDVRTVLHAAYACLLSGKVDEARGFAAKGLSLAPELGECHYVSGLTEESSNQTRAAEKSYRRACELAPGSPDFARALGALLARLGRYLEAIDAWSRAANLSDNAPADLLGLAFALLGAGDAKKAAATFDAVLSKDPGNLDALLNLGLTCQEKLRDKVRAIEAYETYLKKGGTDPRVPGWLASLRGD